MDNKYILGSRVKTVSVIVLGLMLSFGSCGWKGMVADAATEPKQTAGQQVAALRQLPEEVVASPVLQEIPGTVTISRQYPLLAHTKGRIKRLFFQPGQYVRKGDILVKGYDHNFVVAPTHALVAERLIDGMTYMTPNTVVASMMEVQPFQIQLMPPTPFTQAVAPGWEARLSRWGSEAVAAGGVVVGTYLNTDGSLMVDLRLRSLSCGPLPVGTKIRAVLAPPHI
jgi:hypothetical protein